MQQHDATRSADTAAGAVPPVSGSGFQASPGSASRRSTRLLTGGWRAERGLTTGMLTLGLLTLGSLTGLSGCGQGSDSGGYVEYSQTAPVPIPQDPQRPAPATPAPATTAAGGAAAEGAAAEGAAAEETGSAATSSTAAPAVSAPPAVTATTSGTAPAAADPSAGSTPAATPAAMSPAPATAAPVSTPAAASAGPANPSAAAAEPAAPAAPSPAAVAGGTAPGPASPAGTGTPASGSEPVPAAGAAGDAAAATTDPAAPTEPRTIELLIAEKVFRRERNSKAVRVSYDDIDLLKVLNMEPVPIDATRHFPEWLKALDGTEIRIRGFMYPTFEATGLTSFTLARDNGICCFVRQPKIYDIIAVQLADGVTTDYIEGKPFDVEGVFRIQPEADETELYRLYRIENARVLR